MEELARQLGRLAEEVGKLEFTPSPSRRQFVSQASVQIVCAMIQAGSVKTQDEMVSDALNMAKNICHHTKEI